MSQTVISLCFQVEHFNKLIFLMFFWYFDKKELAIFVIILLVLFVLRKEVLEVYMYTNVYVEKCMFLVSCCFHYISFYFSFFKNTYKSIMSENRVTFAKIYKPYC